MLNRVLRLLRTYMGLRQTEAAERLGISQSYLSEVESGAKVPTLELIGRYSSTFEVPVSTIMLFSENLDDKSSLAKARTLVAGKVVGLLEFLEGRAGVADA